eukprot:CAMPEP_0197887606 /NCGR_PEP_ID=MMETSP1439-20131203/19517_1 /TAXON_ID=66791 /ORGANISM="Gonyaulax spinifera, Strain CCMP409" /LENGTH=53 /DNA_ID=CAMNT_0043507457 /DNA_START=71 /DNA_END=230 /DNA_ORIENTATION=-
MPGGNGAGGTALAPARLRYPAASKGLRPGMVGLLQANMQREIDSSSLKPRAIS